MGKKGPSHGLYNSRGGVAHVSGCPSDGITVAEAGQRTSQLDDLSEVFSSKFLLTLVISVAFPSSINFTHLSYLLNC